MPRNRAGPAQAAFHHLVRPQAEPVLRLEVALADFTARTTWR
jgi:hypothetical protein